MLKQWMMVRAYMQIAICKSLSPVPLPHVGSISLAASREGEEMLKQGTMVRAYTQIAISGLFNLLPEVTQWGGGGGGGCLLSYRIS